MWIRLYGEVFYSNSFIHFDGILWMNFNELCCRSWCRCWFSCFDDLTLYLEWSLVVAIEHLLLVFIEFTPMWIDRAPTLAGIKICASPFPSTMTLVPRHSPVFTRPPVMTSQYWPVGKLVNNLTFISYGSRLNATNPRVPRLNAIWFFPLFQKLTTGAVCTTFLNATIFRMAGQRCSQTQPFTHWPLASNFGEVMRPSLSLGGPAVGM